MFEYFLFLVYKIFKFFVLLLPKSVVKFFLDVLAFLIYFLNKEHRSYARANLDLVYKNSITDERKQEIIKNCYKNLVYNIYEFIENQTLDLEGLDSKIEMKNEYILLDAIKNKRKIIFITAHYGNWEYGSNYIPLRYGPTTMVGRPLNNDFLNKELYETRSRNNTEMLSKKDASRGLVKALKANRMIGLVIDQHNGMGIDVNFLGQKVKQADSTSRLSLKFDALIIPIFFTMNSFGKYTAHVYDSIDPSNFIGEDRITELTQAQANVMEKHILKNPDQWFWQHKRFKEYNKEIY